MSTYRVVIHSGRVERGEPTDRIIPDDQRLFPDRAVAGAWMREQCAKKKCGGKVLEISETCVDEVEG
jgi:hypothetical protein